MLDQFAVIIILEEFDEQIIQLYTIFGWNIYVCCPLVFFFLNTAFVSYYAVIYAPQTYSYV